MRKWFVNITVFLQCGEMECNHGNNLPGTWTPDADISCQREELEEFIFETERK